MYNKTIIHGRLCKDWAKLTNSKNNVFVANTLANKRFDDTIFYDIFIAEKRVENLLKFIPKGSEIIIEGVVDKPKNRLIIICEYMLIISRLCVENLLNQKTQIMRQIKKTLMMTMFHFKNKSGLRPLYLCLQVTVQLPENATPFEYINITGAPDTGDTEINVETPPIKFVISASTI